MTYNEIQDFIATLTDNGYKKLTAAKATQEDDFEYYKAFRDPKTYDLQYQIFFKFWDFTKYGVNNGWNISITIMPESCKNDVGRRDLELSVDWATNLDKVEDCANKFYSFIITFDRT